MVLVFVAIAALNWQVARCMRSVRDGFRWTRPGFVHSANGGW